MTDQQIRDGVLEELGRTAPEVDLSTLKGDDTLRDELAIDSFDAFQLIIRFSERFGVDVPEEDYSKLTTLDSIVGYFSDRVE